MKAALLLSTLVIGLISVTPSFAQSVSSYSRNFGYPSYAGAPYQAPVFGSSDYGINEAAQRAARYPGVGGVASRSDRGAVPIPPPRQLEVVAFWVVGIVITILSGGVAIYASHHHLWAS
jgi:hypothetical protein